MPTKVAPSGTVAVLVRLSGPVTVAYAFASCSQNTRPQVSVATEVISTTRSLRHVHTEATHGESDERASRCILIKGTLCQAHPSGCRGLARLRPRPAGT